jgi:alpha-tubulin suppressor-like RCC1 family protein
VTYLSQQELDPVNVACGGAHTLVVLKDGGVYVTGREMATWSNNQHVPKQVPLPSGVKAVTGDISDGHGAVVDTEGKLYTWGDNWNGQLGRGVLKEEQANTASQVTVAGDESVRFANVSCGPQHTAAVDTKGRVYTWGYGKSHQLGLDSRDQRNTPQLVGGITSKATKVCERRKFCG